MPEASSDATETTDGRALRSERSREAIAGALFELVGEGDLEPTAQQVADRADVGIRTVFRHFSDMESLYATLDARLLAEVTPMLRGGPPEGVSLQERADALVADRAALFERIAPYKRASNLKRWRSPYLMEQHRALVVALRARLRQWLPELRSAPDEIADALDLVASFEAWDRLRSDQRLGRRRAQATLARAVQALVNELDGPG